MNTTDGDIEILQSAAVPAVEAARNEREQAFMLAVIQAVHAGEDALWLVDTAFQDCRDCGACCRATPAAASPGGAGKSDDDRFYVVPVSEQERDRIPASLTVPHLCTNSRFRGYTTKMACRDGACAALQKGQSSSYAVRPAVCRDFPRGGFRCRAQALVRRGTVVSEHLVADAENYIWSHMEPSRLAQAFRDHPDVLAPVVDTLEEHRALLAWLDENHHHIDSITYPRNAYEVMRHYRDRVMSPEVPHE